MGNPFKQLDWCIDTQYNRRVEVQFLKEESCICMWVCGECGIIHTKEIPVERLRLEDSFVRG